MLLTLIIAIVGLVISLFTLAGLIIKGGKALIKLTEWVKRQKEQDEELASIRHEQSIIMIGVLACLKGTIGDFDEEEIRRIIKMTETHLNEKAHE